MDFRRPFPALFATVFAAACTSDAERIGAGSGATPIDVARPAITLTATDGQPFDFAARTAGKLTFLEFGYTNCPDICPVTMANLATVLKKLAPSDRMKTMVVFVSVDPHRDSLHVLRKWLDAHDVSFIGLTGSRAALDSMQKAVGFGPAIIRQAAPGTSGGATVDHASPVVVFTADDSAHVMYPFGTRQTDWERDLPRLLAVAPRARPAPVAGPQIGVDRVYITSNIPPAPASVYVEIRNTGAYSDTLLGISAQGFDSVSVHQSIIDARQRVEMRHTPRLTIGAGTVVQFAPGGTHGMFSTGAKPLLRGETVRLTLRFARSGAIDKDAMVITQSDVEMATAKRP
jgi:protein SCO1/2